MHGEEANMPGEANMLAEANILCEANIDKLIDCARRGNEPGAALKSHLRNCERCLLRWEAERDLSANLRVLRVESGSLRSSTAARQYLMLQFESRHKERASSLRNWSFRYGGLAAAAALLLAVLLGPATIARLRPAHPAVVSFTESAEAQTDPEFDGFIAVPFAPPLATGESLRIVHTELNPAALASFGVSVDPSWTAQLPADVLEGEDGMPRAVRVSETESGEGGF